MYYGLYIKIGRRFIRVDTTTGYTIDTAKVQFRYLILALTDKGIDYYLRELPRVKLIDIKARDRRYLKSD